MEAKGGLIPLDEALNLILAGNAILTFKNADTGVRFTYKIRIEKQKKKVYFVSVLTGYDNNNDYSYLGIINAFTQEFKHTEKSKIKETATSAMGFKYLINSCKTLKIHPSMQIWHEGTCCRCGRRLTDPDSIKRGLGPECATR